MPDDDSELTGEPGREKEKPVRWWRRHWVLISVSVVVAWAGLELAMLPFGEISALRKVNPGETAFMREQADRAARSGNRPGRSQQWVSLSDVPKDLVNAVVVAEDGTFWWHSGFDWFELKESVERDLMEGRAARGASTITQQLVKNLYLTSSKSPLRKMREWVLTWWMEQALSKSRILELYLNVIEWGPGVYGAQAASQAYFQKDVTLLTRQECARLAAIIPSPKRHRADEESRYLDRRTAMILDRMAARGF